jgi:hypothetical protein
VCGWPAPGPISSSDRHRRGAGVIPRPQGALLTTQTDSRDDADINFCFGPLCPFAWMTSKWVRQAAAQRDYTVDWRFISLRV